MSNNRMRAVHLEAGRVEVRETPIPERPSCFALIRLITAGVCNTDLELQRGYYGFVGTPGHEFVGEVVEADTKNLIGKRVVGEINFACGFCDYCLMGIGRHCPHRAVLGIVKHPGAFQEYFTVPEHNLLVVPDDLPSDRAVFTEPTAAACEILEQAAIPAGAPIAVLGDGKLGLLIAQVLLAAGHAVHHFGRHINKLSISATAGASISTKDLPPASFDWVVEATGSSAGLESAAFMVRPRGTIFLKSTVHEKVSVDMARLIVNEVTLIGSRCGRFKPALHLLHTGKVKVDRMIAHRVPLAEAPRAFELAATRGTLKVLIDHHV